MENNDVQLKAMKAVYGPFDTLAPSEASSWTPPQMAEGHRGRYLWTDAFGVLNFLTLGALTSDTVYNTLAARLIQAVTSWSADSKASTMTATEPSAAPVL